jgi:SSS family solute:Na+ symporter
MIKLALADILIIVLYILLLLYLGYRTFKQTSKSQQSDFLLANRSLTLPSFVATLVTTWYGGILGIGEFAYTYGLSTWIVFGLPYYIFALLYALILAPKVRQAGVFTIADMFYQKYSKSVGLFSSLCLLFMTTPAPYILIVALIIQIILGWSFFISLLVGTFFSMIYIYWGGFRSVIRTNQLQFLLMYSGFIILLGYAIFHFGGWSFLKMNLPSLHLNWHGNNSIQYILVWFFIAFWTFVDPGFHQRCSAAKSERLARQGILVSIFFWFIFDFLTLSTGLYAAAALKNIKPVLAYPLLANTILPPFLKGLFFSGMLAVVMSTIDSYTLLSAITFGRDIIWRIRKNPDESHTVLSTRTGLLVTAVVSVLLAWSIPSIIQLWYVIGTLFIPPMLLPLLTAYYPQFRLRSRATFLIMVTSFSISLFWFTWGQVQKVEGLVHYPFNLEPFFPGLLSSIVLYSLSNVYQKIKNNRDREHC